MGGRFSLHLLLRTHENKLGEFFGSSPSMITIGVKGLPFRLRALLFHLTGSDELVMPRLGIRHGITRHESRVDGTGEGTLRD